MTRVETINSQGKKKYPVKAVEVLKIIGQASSDSMLIDGYALEEHRANDQMPKVVEDAKIAMLDFDLRKKPLKFGIQMVIKEAEKLQAMRATEIEAVEKKCQLILDSGANVVLTTGGIDEIAQQYFVSHGILAVRRVAKKKMKRIAKLTGGQVIAHFSNMDGDDELQASSLGTAERVCEERVGDRNVVFIRGARGRP